MPACLATCLYVCLGYCLHTYVPKYRAVHPSIHQSIHPSIHPSIYPSVRLSSRQTDCLSTCMSVYRSIWPPISAVLQVGGAQDITFSGSQRHSFNHLVGYIDDRLVRPRPPALTIHHRRLYLYTCISICLHTYLPTYLFTYLPACLLTSYITTTYLPFYLHTHLPASPFICLSLCLFVHSSIHLSSIYSVVHWFCSQDVLLVKWNLKIHSGSYEEIYLPALTGAIWNQLHHHNLLICYWYQH
jgi:hypothetical protein